MPGTAGKRLLQRASDKVTQFHSAERRFGFDSLEERVRQVNRSSHKSIKAGLRGRVKRRTTRIAPTSSRKGTQSKDLKTFAYLRVTLRENRGDAGEARRDQKKHRVWVSVASAWEIEIKMALGKLQLPDDLLAQMTAVKFDALPIRIEHALCLRRLPVLHPDPFDRILIAQALCEGLTLVTSDPILSGYPVRIIRAD